MAAGNGNGIEHGWERRAGRARLLLIEDEPRITSFLLRGFASEGFEAESAADGLEALDTVVRFDPNLVILDLGLPGIDGLDLLRRLTEHRPEVPVLILSARRDLESRLAGLRGGARDYIVKPFSFEELLERVVIQLRTAGRETTPVVRAGELSFDLRTRTVDLGDGPIPLTERESRLLEHLLRHRGEVVSRERLLSAVWGYSFRTDTNVVEVGVKRLRDKLGTHRIETVRGSGYRFVG